MTDETKAPVPECGTRTVLAELPFYNELAEAWSVTSDEARLIYLKAIHAGQITASVSANGLGRDADWVLAIGHALGLDSGYSVPIVPEVEPFKALFDAIRTRSTSGSRMDGIEEVAKLIDRKGQDLTNEYCHGDAGPDGYVWTNKEAEWQVILLDELADEVRALKSATPVSAIGTPENEPGGFATTGELAKEGDYALFDLCRRPF